MFQEMHTPARHISLCIPNYRRHDLLVESFAQVLGDNRISEIVIMDDCSPNLDEVDAAVKSISSPKVRLFKGDTNLGPFHNKARAVAKCREQFCILLDSDNIIGRDYLDLIFALDWNEQQVVCPENLVHHPANIFNDSGIFISYSSLVGQKLDMQRCKADLTDEVQVLMNTGNFFVSVAAYLAAFEGNTFDRSVDITDVGFFNYLFLRHRPENHLLVCKGLQYVHRVHHGSFYLNHADQSPAQRDRLRKLMLGQGT